MNKDNANTVLIIIYVALITMAAVLESEVKAIPLLIIGLYGIVTILCLVTRVKIVATVFLYMWLYILLGIGTGLIMDWIVGMINPHRGQVMVNGEWRHVMDMAWILDLIVAFTAAPGMLIFYHKKELRSRGIEIAAVSTFTLITFLMYIKHLA